MHINKIILRLYQFLRKHLAKYQLDNVSVLDQIHKIVIARLKTNQARVRGRLMYLDPLDSLRLSINGVYEEFETSVITQLVKPGNRVVDVGAHIGYYTLILADLVGPKGRVYAFEPDPANFKLLSKNVIVNEFDSVTLINQAVTDKVGEVKLFTSQDNLGDHQIYSSDPSRESVNVKSTSLDKYFRNKAKIDLIKVDIQGSEPAALTGMRQLLITNPNIIVLSEFWPWGIKQFGYNPGDYLKTWQNYGFQILEIQRQNKKIAKTTPSKLKLQYPISSQKFTDLLLVRELNRIPTKLLS